MKLISIVTPCYNEEENIDNIYLQVKAVMATVPQYAYEHIFIDNCSKDNTVVLLREIASKDRSVKIILNARNFGFMRSQFYGLLAATGDAAILIVADLQDPPEIMLEFLKQWENGFKIIAGVKPKSKENPFMFFIRKMFYKTIAKISDVSQIQNFMGFGLYDKSFVDILRKLDEPYPYFRGLVAELGYNIKEVSYIQPKRERGKSNYSFYNLYDTAMIGFINHSRVPLRLASFTGVLVSMLSILIALIYLIYKLLFWYDFQVGLAPIVIGIFFLGGIQLLFLGIIGEYVGVILTQVKKRPLVIERERINF